MDPIRSREIKASTAQQVIPILFGVVSAASGLYFLAFGYMRFSQGRLLGLFGVPFIILGAHLIRGWMIQRNAPPFVKLDDEELSFATAGKVNRVAIADICGFQESRMSFSIGSSPAVVVLTDGRQIELPNLHGVWDIVDGIVEVSNGRLAIETTNTVADQRLTKLTLIVVIPLAILLFLYDHGYLSR